MELKMKYSYGDIAISPSVLSEIEHRSECNPFDNNGFLPIFTAPMSCVVNESNFEIFEKNHIYPILPRNIDFNIRIKNSLENKWSAFSLSEFKDFFCNEEMASELLKVSKKALIDVANGHMKCLYDIVKKAKTLYGNSLTVMIGNIANPETYKVACESGVDFIRCCIGVGEGCTSSSNVAIHYPNVSLISEIKEIKKELEDKKNTLKQNNNLFTLTRIIADGGIRNYSDVIKAIAIGADYVMIGGLLSKMVESAAKTFIINENDVIEIDTTKTKILEQDGKFILYNDEMKEPIEVEKVYKEFYGMSSKKGQIDINGIKTKTSEGTEKILECKTNLHKWSDNMKSYIQSAMSYTNNKTLEELKNNTKVILISNNTKNSINK